MQALRSVPEQGQLAIVRQRRYVVTDVRQGASGAELTERPQHLVSLTSIEDDALGEELQVIWEIEPGARAFEKMELPEPKGFDQPAHLEAFLDAVRWGAASIADTRQLQSPFRSGIEIESYQLDPVVRAIQMPRVNLLIADDVGLGKTIESGMVVLELMLRHRANRVLVVCPSSLQIKWRDEMLEKFGLDFAIVDSALIKRLRRERGLYANPWTHFPRLITSMDYLKREYPLRMFREAVAHDGARPGPARLRHPHRRRSPQRRAQRHRQLRPRLAAHPGPPRNRQALRAQALPHRHAAQRLQGELLRAAGTARRPALRAQRRP
jgi:hypothetical protein